VATSVCDHFYLSDLDHRLGYLIKISAQNLSSLPAIFAVQVDSLGRSPLETYLSDGINYQVLPPTENFNQGYTLYFSTDSYGKEINRNLLESTEVFYWPYAFIKSLRWQNSDQVLAKSQPPVCDFNVKKKALWFYQVDLPANCDAKYISLAQAYDQGWLAVQEGKQLEQLKLNNWANAWLMQDEFATGSIYIFYWPQLLEYLGLLSIFLLIVFLLFKYRRSQSDRLQKKRSK